MSETATPESVADDPSRYPSRDVTPFVFYGRAVWPMGEDCEDGVMVQGHDRRAWAALNAWAREDGPEARIDLHCVLDGPGPADQRPQARWATFQTTCGCTAEQHADHDRERKAGLAEFRTKYEAGELATPHWRDCHEISGTEDCHDLPPCQTERFAWRMTKHEGDIPADAAPVLEWVW